MGAFDRHATCVTASVDRRCIGVAEGQLGIVVAIVLGASHRGTPGGIGCWGSQIEVALRIQIEFNISRTLDGPYRGHRIQQGEDLFRGGRVSTRINCGVLQDVHPAFKETPAGSFVTLHRQVDIATIVRGGNMAQPLEVVDVAHPFRAGNCNLHAAGGQDGSHRIINLYDLNGQRAVAGAIRDGDAPVDRKGA